jgi:hypothetical protein
MRYLINYFSKLITNEFHAPLGRWKIEYCNSKINKKIDLSNEDHCGPCGQYNKSKIDLDNKIIEYTDK